MSRNKEQRAVAKKLLSKPPGSLEPIDLAGMPHPDWMTRAYSNNRYVVMINDNAVMTRGVRAIKAMVQRHDDKPIPNHWSEMQAIKNFLFGRDATAIEYYPPVRELEDVANIYWLWVLPDDVLPRAAKFKTEQHYRPEDSNLRTIVS